jgi:N6-adenosine-specific RNA methylase IME4
MKHLALPNPEQSSVAVLRASCRAIYDARNEVIGTLPLRQADDWRRKASAIERFLANRQGQDDARRAARILEAAVGAALGPAKHGGDRKSNQDTRMGLDILREDRRRFRLMAAHRTVWEPALIERGLTRAEVLRTIDLLLRPAQPVDRKAATTADLSRLIETGHTFGTIYADPPWLYGNQGTRAATSRHYGGLTVDALCTLPIDKLAAPNAHLHLWTTNGFLFECPKLFDAWGFTFRSSFIWVKPKIGIGNYWRNSHEFLLTAIRGNAKRFRDKNLKSWLLAPRGPHSAKPAKVRDLLERASPAPRLELFGRHRVDGWTVFGNQIVRDLFSSTEAEQ